SAAAYALTSEDFATLAKSYGKLGGLDRIATVVKSVRAERGDRVLMLDGGDTWQNSYTSMLSKGQDMVDCMALLKPDAMVGHWEFTLGAERVKAITEKLGFPFLAQNVRDTEWNEAAFAPMTAIERGGVKLIPVFSDAIAPDAEMAATIAAVRAPHEKMLREVVGRTETLLYRRGNFNGTLDDVICDALLAERDAEIALSPGFRWGNSLLPGQDITREDIYNATALSYPAAYRLTMTGARLK